MKHPDECTECGGRSFAKVDGHLMWRCVECKLLYPTVEPKVQSDILRLVETAQWARNRLEAIADDSWRGDARDFKRSIIGVFADFDEALAACGSELADFKADRPKPPHVMALHDVFDQLFYDPDMDCQYTHDTRVEDWSRGVTIGDLRSWITDMYEPIVTRLTDNIQKERDELRTSLQTVMSVLSKHVGRVDR